ncbi:SWI5/SAE3 family protein [Aspergillus vadensis CBS 113365]|uniref:Swi5-domain-containing protein n=1 Tax=Aspergillus vadensis (strain CBS 113365 / IMI 142717 / IBT 24658) TaxID=1448311 RepID=A0A319BNY6_ASPVC|nr:Swi5-domain-containing protein [Aspergillus vadensis CBS 113365]PYH74064.1 Swi5-domain-containing protein [Aspergillus vadensis CBS 113365]
MPPPQQATSSTTTPASDDQTQNQRDKKLSTLRASIVSLQSQITETESQIEQTKAKLKNDPSTTVKRHIRLLHEYNEIKDIAQGLMGLIADARGVRQVDVQREYGLDDRD